MGIAPTNKIRINYTQLSFLSRVRSRNRWCGLSRTLTLAAIAVVVMMAAVNGSGWPHRLNGHVFRVHRPALLGDALGPTAWLFCVVTESSPDHITVRYHNERLDKPEPLPRIIDYEYTPLSGNKWRDRWGEYSAESDWSWGEYAVERVDLSRTRSMCCSSQLVAEWLYPEGPIGCGCHCAGFRHFKCNLQSLGGFWFKCADCDNRYDPACKNVADALPIKLASGGPWRHRWTAS